MRKNKWAIVYRRPAHSKILAIHRVSKNKALAITCHAVEDLFNLVAIAEF